MEYHSREKKIYIVAIIFSIPYYEFNFSTKENLEGLSRIWKEFQEYDKMQIHS